MSIEMATANDLQTILGWLELEFNEDNAGFWCNRATIENSHKSGGLWVFRESGEAIAFQVGEYGEDIACVRKDRQRRGIGTKLFKAALARAYLDNINVLRGSCEPSTSLPFWIKQGFKLTDQEGLKIRFILERDHPLPENAPRVHVNVSFFNESVKYETQTKSIADDNLLAAQLETGELLLERRVIGLKDDVPSGKDLVVRIKINGVERYFEKAKRAEAKNIGVLPGKDCTFYIDRIHMRKTSVSGL